MVESEKIKEQFIQLIRLVKAEAELNATIKDYLNDYNQKFLSKSTIYFVEDLNEFLRGANRYSDEFSFSDRYKSEIRKKTDTLYEILNSALLTSPARDTND